MALLSNLMKNRRGSGLLGSLLSAASHILVGLTAANNAGLVMERSREIGRGFLRLE